MLRLVGQPNLVPTLRSLESGRDEAHTQECLALRCSVAQDTGVLIPFLLFLGCLCLRARYSPFLILSCLSCKMGMMLLRLAVGIN